MQGIRLYELQKSSDKGSVQLNRSCIKGFKGQIRMTNKQSKSLGANTLSHTSANDKCCFGPVNLHKALKPSLVLNKYRSR